MPLISDRDVIAEFLEADPAPCVVDCEPVFDALERVTGLHLVRRESRWRLESWNRIELFADADLPRLVRKAMKQGEETKR